MLGSSFLWNEGELCVKEGRNLILNHGCLMDASGGHQSERAISLLWLIWRDKRTVKMDSWPSLFSQTAQESWRFEKPTSMPLISGRQLRLTNSLKCQKINVKRVRRVAIPTRPQPEGDAGQPKLLRRHLLPFPTCTF